jgi:putative FmdB family regulatory protein
MPIYEFACPKCRKIFSFLSKRTNPAQGPACPKCGSKDLTKEISRFAMIKGAPAPASEGSAHPDEAGGPAMPDFDDPRVAKVMDELERDIDHLDENNPRHMAHMLRKMQQALPPDSVPKEMEVALRRLEAGEDPEKIEADMGDVLGDWLGPGGGDSPDGSSRGGRGYSRDPGLYDY